MTLKDRNYKQAREGMIRALNIKLDKIEEMANEQPPAKIRKWRNICCEFNSLYNNSTTFLRPQELEEIDTKYIKTTTNYFLNKSKENTD